MGVRRLRNYVWALWLGGLLVCAAVIALHPLHAHAATITVTNTNDTTNTGDGVSLREAVLSINQGSNLNTDVVAVGSYGTNDTILFGSGGIGTINVTSTLSLTANVTITGPTSGVGVTVDGQHVVQIFSFPSGVTTAISNLTIAHGKGSADFYIGGGITNNGTLTLTNCTFSSNLASFFGGGIVNHGGTLTVTDSTFSGNIAGYDGGGIFNDGRLTVTHSTFAGNTSAYGGGAIENEYQGLLIITGSTFSGNTGNNLGGSGMLGGAIKNGNNAIITGTTFANNSTPTGAGGSGGGIAHSGNSTTLVNTIVAGNTAPSGPDILGAVTSNGHNLLGDASGSSGITNGTNGDIVNPNPLLGPLGDNGGPTQTIALLSGSPAIGNGAPAICAATGTGNPGGLDQRGLGRPPDACAIGAFEPHTLAAISPASGSVTGGSVVALTGLGFMPGATVTVGGVACTVNSVSSTTLRCKVGAHEAGTVDVTVVSGGATNTLTSAYTYGVVNALPPSPPPSGGTSGSPNPLPGQRQTGGSGGNPSPLPPSRP